MSTSNREDDSEGSEQAPCDASATRQLVRTAAKRKKAPSPHNCRNFIRKQTANAMPEIVDTFVEHARKGSVPHFASLAKVGGFDQRTGASEAPKRKRKSLARQLLDEVEKYEAKQAAELAAANAEASQIGNLNPEERS